MANIRKYITTSLLTALIPILAACNNSDTAGKEQATYANIGAQTITPAVECKMPTPMDSLRPMLDRRMRQVFNDSNHMHLPHAEHLGIHPIQRVADAYFTSRPMVKITDTGSYLLDTLTHSVPYLVPEAATLLADISTAFRDTLNHRGLPPMRLKITSLLRTGASVKRLRRINSNATQQSAHQYGTTFDISYRRFYLDANGAEVYDPRYRLALAEALYDLRAANRCMVKFEAKTPCFHITVIK